MYIETYSIFSSKQESAFADKLLFRREDYKANVNDCKSLMWSEKDTKIENSKYYGKTVCDVSIPGDLK